MLLLRRASKRPTTVSHLTLQQQQQRHIHATSQSYMGIDKVAENKIAEWLHNRGDESIGSTKKGKEISSDRHRDLSRTLGVHNDYVHSKILADNNIKPESLERRLALDAAWEKLKGKIQLAYYQRKKNHDNTNTKITVDEFVLSKSTRDQFEDEIMKLDKLAKKVNDSIISDSMRFNGRSPVRHARRYSFEERVREAITCCTP